MANGEITDPYGSYNFLVEIDSFTCAGFQEVSGLDATTDVVEHREGGDNLATRKLPGMTKFGNLTLKRGMTDDVELYQWHKRVAEGDIERKNGSIVLLNRKREEVARWNFVRAWPTKWTGPALNAEKSDAAIETLEITHEGIERA